MSEEKAKKPNFVKRIIIICFAVVFFFIAVYLMGLTNQLGLGEEELEKELAEEKLRTEELRHKYESELDEDYIIDVARDHGYAFPDEEIYYNNLPKS